MYSSWSPLGVQTENAWHSAPAINYSRTISTHVLDTSSGKGAANMSIMLYRLENLVWQQVSQAVTKEDGRVTQLLRSDEFKTGLYKLHFAVQAYFNKLEVPSYYPYIEIVVQCNKEQNYHIPLMVNPYSYTTYKEVTQNN